MDLLTEHPFNAKANLMGGGARLFRVKYKSHDKWHIEFRWYHEICFEFLWSEIERSIALFIFSLVFFLSMRHFGNHYKLDFIVRTIVL